jgi:aryl-alcohol dehydrogenase-like predicted oxidoreductase
MRKVRLGGTRIEITPIGLGCWQFSRAHGYVGRFWDDLPEEGIREIVARSLEGGINWFDTAEIYGWGRSETALAAALRANGVRPGEIIVATKWFPFLRRAGSIRRTIGERLKALGGYPVDLHQIHAPVSLSGVRSEMRVMARLVREGAIGSVGVSNYSAGQMRRAHAALRREGLVLASNQVKYSLLHRKIERNGVLETAKELGITIIAYSPLAQGILSGKYHEDPARIKQRPGPRKSMPAFKRRALLRTRPLIEELRSIAEAHGATPAQVALSWLTRIHGDTVVVIPGAVDAEQARQNAGALDLTLSVDEIERLDGLSFEVVRTS